MEYREIEKKVSELAIENAIEINNDGVFLDFDSFSFVSFLVSMEDEFEITFPDTSLNFANMNTVDTVVKMVSMLQEGICQANK